MKLSHFLFISTILLTTLAHFAFAQPLQIISSTPLQGALSVAKDSDISVTFNQNIQLPSTHAFYVVSSTRGIVSGAVGVTANTLTFHPDEPLKAGDHIRVGLTTNIVSVNGDALATPLLLQFTVKVEHPQADPAVYKQFDIPYSNRRHKDLVRPLDFDNDGDIDVITTGIWLENDGNENYIEHAIEMDYAFEFKAVDFDHDNDWDLLLGTYGGVAILINDGSMNFTTHYVPDTNIATSISVADQNGDGLEDILYADQLSGAFSLAWLFNNGDGTFTKSVLNDTELSYVAQAADIDNDNLIDVAVVGRNFVYWYRNTGSSYEKNLLYENPNTSVFYGRLIVGDTDNDGDLDILASGNGTILQLINNGAGSFTDAAIGGSPFVSNELLDVADIDGDSDLDIIGASGYTIVCFVNQGENTFFPKTVTTFNQNINAASVADMDDDGDLDIAFALYYGPIGWAKNTTYAEAAPFDSHTLTDVLPESTRSASWADYDMDGDQDLLITGYEGSTPLTRIYRRTTEGLEIAKELPALVNATAIWFDFDNDADADVLLSGASSTADPWNNTKTMIFINSAGEFSEDASLTFLNGTYSAQIAAADLDNDGTNEIILTGQNAGVYALQNGVFVKVYSMEYISQGGRLAISDIDLDGDLDIAATGWLGNDDLGALGSIYVNMGNFKFEEQKKAFNGITSGTLLFNDFDNDSDPDLASIGSHRSAPPWSSNYASSSFYNNEGGVLEKIAPPETMIYVGYGGAASAADFDNDGYSDVITQHGNGWYGLSLYLNNGVGWFTSFDYTFPAVSSDDDFIEPVDFDRDHDLDILVGNKLIRNNTDVKNTVPTAPTVLVDSVRNNFLYMHWSGAADAETVAAGLTYQPFVGSSADSQDVMSAMANLTTGERYVARAGVARKMWKSRLSVGGDYHWGVQAIDAGLMGSAFASKPVRVIHIEGENKSCSNMVQTYRATPVGTYTWHVEGGEIVSMSDDEISIEWIADAGSVKVSDGVNSNILDVHVVDKPAPLIAGPSVVCADANDQYSTPHVEGHAYHWAVDGANFLRSADSSLVFVKWETAGSGRITMFETSRENICTIEVPIEIAVREKTSPSIAGPSDVCLASGITSYSVSPLAGSTLIWSVYGGQIIGSTASSQINVSWSDQAFGRVIVEERNDDYCKGTDILEIDLLSIPSADIQGASTACNETAGLVYSTESLTNVTYQWAVDGGTINGPTNQASVSVNWIKKGTGKIIVIQRFASCVSKDSLYVTFYPAIAPPRITSSGDVLTASDALRYQWFDNDETIPGAVSQTFIPNAPGTYRVEITDSKGCSALSYGHSYLITGLEDKAAAPSVSTYPNPVRDDFYVELDNEYRGPVDIKFLDAAGRVISSSESWKHDQKLLKGFSLSGVNASFLMLKITTGDVTIHRKLVVEK